MKKFSILSILLVFMISVNAQEYRSTAKKEIVSSRHSVIDDFETNQNMPAPYSKIGGVPIGGSQNIYGVMLDGPHQVMYSSGINTVVFTHRALDSGTGNSGEMAFDFSSDGGETWTTECWISPNLDAAAAGNGCRYPSITIFNPEGNTDIANARVVANGPALCDATASWGFSYEIDATIEASPTIGNEYYGSNTGTNNDFHPYSASVGPDGTVWSISSDFSAGGEDNLNYYHFYVNKAIYNGGTDQFDWTSPIYTIIPDYYYDGADRFSGWGWDIAVDPNDGNIVYAMVNCQEVADMNAGNTSVAPHIWKTIDGGTTWNQQTLLDYAPFEAELEDLIYYDSDAGDSMHPKARNVDMTVDDNGVLHCFIDLGSDAETWASHYGQWVYEEGNPNGIPTRHYVDFTLNGSTWDMEYIAPVQCEDAPWGDVATYRHPQVARTESGDNIFYAWQETLFDADSLNTAPNMMVASWNSTGGMNGPTNITEGTGAEGICYFSQVSPVVIDNGTGVPDEERYELPIVISLIDFASGADTDPVGYMYLYDFFIPNPVSVNSVSKPEVIIYPNPVAEKVFVSVGAKVEMYNILGARLLTVEGRNDVTTIEMSRYPAGTYLLKVYTDEGIVTKKIQKVN